MKKIKKFGKKFVRIKKRENKIKGCMKIDKICCKHWLITILLVFSLIPVMVSGATESHPSLLFNDIKETPGYQHRTESPWSNWEQSIINSATNSLSRNFQNSKWTSYNRISNRAQFASELALAYQITKDAKYAIKAKESLLNLEKGDALYKMDRSDALRGYSLTYDWIQPYLDPSSDSVIRNKLALLADAVYKDLNDGGTKPDYISFADYHGQAYPSIGFAGLVLYNYTNPNKIPLSSSPPDWLKAGTEYLFVNDKLHSYNRPLFSFGFDEAGKHLNGEYKSYVIDDFIWWFQAYSHFFAKNIFNEYPVAKRAFTSELWESMPNNYNNNFITSGNTKEFYHKGIINLLDNNNKSYALNHIDLIEKSNLLPYSSGTDSMTSSLLYIVYGDYSSIQRKNPSWTSHFDQSSVYQVFRGNWNSDSDWLSLITWNAQSNSNRDMAHHDQMSFEYYSRGDLLLAEAGENKYVLDKYYGEYEVHHNTVAIENPRAPFTSSPWSNSPARGLYKGDANGVITPAYIENLVQTPWVELLDVRTTIIKVIDSSWSTVKTLSSPIGYKREIIYPNKDYFFVIDRFEGKETWKYRNIFRPTSLNIVPTIDKNKDNIYSQLEIGNVNGSLTIGSKPYNWLSLLYKKETATGINTSSVKWNTTNPYGKNVKLQIFSVPSSDVLVTKHVGRIAGYTSKSEVFSPIVYFQTKPVKELFRITVLLSRYQSEEERIPTELAVTGTGNAIKVKSSKSEDYIYSGKGRSSFASISTDADTLYLRKATYPSEYTMLNGSYINYSGMPLVGLSKKVDYFTLKEEQNKTTFKIKGSGTAQITLYQVDNASYEIIRDGTTYYNWSMNNAKMIILTSLSDHDFEVITKSSAKTTPGDATATPAPTATATPTPTPGNSGAIYNFEVESGQNGGWTVSGLWHITGNRYSSYNHSFWYGKENTRNYDTGVRNYGVLASPAISLSNVIKPVLSFMSWYQTESGISYDRKFVQISVNNGSWTNLKQVAHNQNTWVREQIDLSAYVNKNIKIRFFFDTTDNKYNSYEGWYIDDVKINGG